MGSFVFSFLGPLVFVFFRLGGGLKNWELSHGLWWQGVHGSWLQSQKRRTIRRFWPPPLLSSLLKSVYSKRVASPVVLASQKGSTFLLHVFALSLFFRGRSLEFGL